MNSETWTFHISESVFLPSEIRLSTGEPIAHVYCGLPDTVAPLRVADRQTVEFDDAREAIAKAHEANS